MTEQASNQLYHHVIRVSKEDSAFVYFQLESNEGLGFFSTLNSSMGEPFRDIEIFSPISLTKEVDHFLSYLGTKIAIQYREKDIVDDKSNLLVVNKGSNS